MPQYFLRNPWLAPNGAWYDAARVHPVEIPDDLVPFLPKSAELSDGGSRVKPNPAPMANVRTVGGPAVNSAQIFAAQVSQAPSQPAEAPAPEVPNPATVDVEAAEAFARARAEEEARAEADAKARADAKTNSKKRK